MERELLLVAASGVAREAAESPCRARWEVPACLDDKPGLSGTEIMPGVQVWGGLESIADFPDLQLLLCAGKGDARQGLAERLAPLGVTDERYAVLVDTSVAVPASCMVRAGSLLLAGTVLTASVTVGRHVVCMPQVVLTHDYHVEDFGTLCAGGLLGGGVTVGTGAYLGRSSRVREDVQIGVGAVVGMGGVATRDAAPMTRVAGITARPLNGATV